MKTIFSRVAQLTAATLVLFSVGAVAGFVIGTAALGSRYELVPAMRPVSIATPVDQGGSAAPEHKIGEAVMIAGCAVTVISAGGFVSGSPHGSDAAELVVDLNILDHDPDSGTTRCSSWRLSTPDGQALEPALATSSMGVERGVTDPSASALRLVFRAMPQPGDYLLLFEPDPGSPARGTWKVDFAWSTGFAGNGSARQQ